MAERSITQAIPAAPTIVVIDSDVTLLDQIDDALRQRGYTVYTAYEAQEGLGQVATLSPDLAIIDSELAAAEGGGGFQRLREMIEIPVMIMAKRGTEEEIVLGLNQGVDDYLTKPFAMEELVTRVRVLLRRAALRAERDAPNTYVDDYLAINLDDRRVMVEGELVQLTPTEYRLLSTLLTNAGRALSYAELLEKVWGREYTGYVDYARIYTWRLRKKIERDPQHPDYILTEHGVGYRFEAAKTGRFGSSRRGAR
jgi:two-component system KDP operon response regulator KdpE